MFHVVIKCPRTRVKNVKKKCKKCPRKSVKKWEQKCVKSVKGVPARQVQPSAYVVIFIVCSGQVWGQASGMMILQYFTLSSAMTLTFICSLL